MNTIFFGESYTDFSQQIGKITISTGPVIISKDNNKVLLHLSPSTQKYQFIGGRYHDTISFQQNALERAKEVIQNNSITLLDAKPTIILDEIKRNNETEKLLLVHYKATIEDEENIGEGKWFSLEEIYYLEAENMISSPNIVLCSEHFLKN